MRTMSYQTAFRHGAIRHQFTIRWVQLGSDTHPWINTSSISEFKAALDLLVSEPQRMSDWCDEHIGKGEFWLEHHETLVLVYFKTQAAAMQFKLAFA